MTVLAVSDRGAGPGVVLLHGQPGEGREWERVAKGLEDRMRVLVPDRPGYGRTAAPAAGMAANADAVIDLLDQRAIGAVVIVGHSWGGGVALAAAQRHPDRVRALVLAGSVGGLGSIVRLDRLLTAPIFGPTMALAGIAAISAPRLARVLAGAPLRPPEGQTGWYRSWRSFVTEQRALVDELPGITARLGQIRVPAVVVVGGTDRVVRPSSQRDLAARLPNGRLVELAGVGHLVPREAPARLANLIAGLGPVRPSSAADGTIEVT